MKLSQLSIRDFFWILTLAGVLFAWWVDRQIDARKHVGAPSHAYPHGFPFDELPQDERDAVVESFSAAMAEWQRLPMKANP